MSSFLSKYKSLMFLPFVILGFLIYANTLDVPFYLDDFSSIIRNPQIRLTDLGLKDTVGVGLALKGFSKRPVAHISFALNYYFHQNDVLGYHLVNILIHITAGILLYLFTKATLFISMKESGQSRDCSTLQSLNPSVICFFASLIWLIHPIQTQSVTYIVQRMNSMAAMFYILSLWLYVRGRLVKKRQTSWLYFGGCILGGILAIGSKEIAATLPFFILLYEWYFFQDVSTAWLKRHFPHMLGLLLTFGLLMFFYLGLNPLGTILSNYEHWDFTLTERVLTQCRVVIYYISLLVFPRPSRLDLNHDFALSHSLVNPMTTLLSMGVIVGLIGLAIYMTRRQRLVSFCILWFFGNLAIESSIIPLDLTFEHRTYLPSMLFFLLVIVAGYRYISHPKAVVGVLCVIALLLASWTYARNNTWRDPVAFWKDSVKKSEKKGRSLVNLGVALAREGKLDEAISYYRKALRIDPHYAPAHNNIGLALAGQGKLDQAITHYSEALRSRSDYPEAHINLGNALFSQGELDKAISHYSKATEYAEAHRNLGRALVKKGKLDEAISHFSEALRIRPDYAGAHSSLGLALAHTGKLDEAISHFSEALRIKPDYAEVHYDLGIVFATRGKLHKAISHYSEALRIKPDYAEAHNNLGILLGQVGRLDEAIDHFSKALQVNPDFAEARANLDYALRKQGNPGKTADSVAAP